jgi:transposase
MWWAEQLAAGSAEALAQRRAEEAETLRLRREVKRLEDENVILRKAPAVFAKGVQSRSGRTGRSSRSCRPNGATKP